MSAVLPQASVSLYVRTKVPLQVGTVPSETCVTVTAPQASVSPVTSLMLAAVTAEGQAKVSGGSAFAVGGVTSVTLVII